MDNAINEPDHGNNVVDGLNAMYNRDLKGEIELMVNWQVTIPQILGCFPLLQNMSPLNLQIKVYIFSIIKKY